MESFFNLIPGFLLVFCRITSFFVVVPIFSSRNVPMTFKIGLSVFISYITFAAVGMNDLIVMDSGYILAILREVLVGLALGFIAYLFFTVVQIAGSLMDMQMGFGIANVIDPLTGVSAPFLGNLKFMLAMVLFLTFNGHHMLLGAIMNSYKWVPISNELFAKMYDGSVSDFIVHSFIAMFSLALQMSAPIVVAMFFVDIGLGLLARVSPQFNIFVIGVPLKIIVGLALLMLLFPGFITLFQDLFIKMFKYMENWLSLVGGR